MLLHTLLIIVGIALVLWSAGLLTDGAAGIASRTGMSQLVIGLTVVAMGTSMPEFFVSLVSALRHSPGMAVGNVVGSNTFNVLLITGLTAMVAPITVTPRSIKRDIPFAVAASAMLVVLCFDGVISRLDALLLTLGFAFFMYVTIKGARDGDDDSTPAKPMKVMKAVLLIAGGLAGLIIGSNIFVSHAASVARALGVSDAVIGLTIVACGTSLPELATSLVAARKGNSGIAIGNVVGSNIFNILMILGITGAIQPLRTAGITMVDFGMMIVSILLMWQMSYSRFRVSRGEGCLLVVLFAAYMTWLVVHA